MTFAWACCLAVFLWVMDLLLDLAGMEEEDTQLMRRGVLFEVALRGCVEVAPAEVTVGTIAAAVAVDTAVAAAAAAAVDTEKIVARVGVGLPEMVLVVEPPGTCLVVGGFDIVDQKANTDSGKAGPLPVD